MNFNQLIQTCERTHNYLQGTAVSAVNQSLTIRNWLFGHYIVEFEQNGEDRAKYGTELLKKLSDHLLVFLLELGKGFCFEARQKRLTKAHYSK